MGRNNFDKDVIVCAVQEYLDGKSSQLAIAKRLGIHGETFRQWVKNYQAMGTDAFGGHKSKRYSKGTKEQAVLDYISGRGSITETYRLTKQRTSGLQMRLKRSTQRIRRWAIVVSEMILNGIMRSTPTTSECCASAE